jgi:hypothetical protein
LSAINECLKILATIFKWQRYAYSYIFKKVELGRLESIIYAR